MGQIKILDAISEAEEAIRKCRAVYEHIYKYFENPGYDRGEALGDIKENGIATATRSGRAAADVIFNYEPIATDLDILFDYLVKAADALESRQDTDPEHSKDCFLNRPLDQATEAEINRFCGLPDWKEACTCGRYKKEAHQ